MNIDTKHAHGSNGNHTIYASLEDNQLLDVIVLSALDDTINHLAITSHNMPETCINIFGSVQFLYEHFENYIGNSERVFVSDIGSISIVEIIDRKGKPVKLQCQLPTNKIIDPIETNKFYLRIIRQLIQNQKQHKSQFSSSLSRQESRMVAQQPIKMQKLGSSKLSFISDSKYEKLPLSAEISQNIDYDNFKFFQDRIKIVKFSNKRLNLFFRQAIPKDRSVYFTIKVMNLKKSALSVGLYDKNQIRIVKPSEYNFCFDFGKGKIKCSGDRKDQARTDWHHLKKIVPSNLIYALLRTEVNLKEGKLSFYCNGALMVQTLLSNYMMSKQMVPYINCKHMGDEFKINVE